MLIFDFLLNRWKQTIGSKKSILSVNQQVVGFVCFEGQYNGDLGLYTEYVRENNWFIPLDPQKVSFAGQNNGDLGLFYSIDKRKQSIYSSWSTISQFYLFWRPIQCWSFTFYWIDESKQSVQVYFVCFAAQYDGDLGLLFSIGKRKQLIYSSQSTSSQFCLFWRPI